MSNDVNPYDLAGVRRAAERRKQRGPLSAREILDLAEKWKGEPAAEPQPAYDAKCICGHQRIDHNPFKGGYCQRCKPSCAGFLAEPAAEPLCGCTRDFVCTEHIVTPEQAELARLTTHIAAQNEVLSALCAEAGVDFTDVEAAKKAMDGRTAELEQVKAERDQLNKNADTLERHMVEAETLIRGLMLRAKGWPEYTEAEQWLEAALGEKGE